MGARLYGLGIVFVACAACAGREGTPAAGSDSGVQDAGPSPVNARPCAEPAPFFNDSGYEMCRGGMIHRKERRVCPSSVPRPDFTTPEDGKSLYFCRKDSDCSAMGAHAYCTYNGGGFAPSAYICQEGCIEDAECGAGNISVCNAVAGNCFRADCMTDGDCTPGFLCASFAIECGGQTTQFGCQLPGDQCGGDGDCDQRQFCSRTPAGFSNVKPRRCQDITCVP